MNNSPRNKPVKGDKILSVLSIKWLGKNRFASVSDCNKLANDVKNCTMENSRGLYNFKIDKATVVKVPYNAAKKNINKAEDFCKRKFKGADIYCIINNGEKDFSNAGGNTAHLTGALGRTGCHEVFHLLGLGHSGMYIYEKDKIKLDHYGDRQSVMGRYASKFITAPQYYHQGWLFENECVDFNNDFEIFELRKINDLKTTNKLAAIRIVLEQQRNAFVSYSGKGTIVLHLSNGGGSQLIANFANEYTDDRFTGLTIKKISSGNGLIKLSIAKNTFENNKIELEESEELECDYDNEFEQQQLEEESEEESEEQNFEEQAEEQNFEEHTEELIKESEELIKKSEEIIKNSQNLRLKYQV